MIEQAVAQGRQVVCLNRGKPGHSTFPNTYRTLSERFVNLHMRVAYALRPNFIFHANGLLPLWQQGTPFTLDKTLPSARMLVYTELINIRHLVDEFMHRLGPAHPAYQKALRINVWDWEETCARIAGYGPWAANFVKQVRGRKRNAIFWGW